MDMLFSGPVMWFLFGFACGFGLLPQPEWAKAGIEKLKLLLSSFMKGPTPTDPPPADPTKPSANT